MSIPLTDLRLVAMSPAQRSDYEWRSHRDRMEREAQERWRRVMDERVEAWKRGEPVQSYVSPPQAVYGASCFMGGGTMAL